MLMASLHSVIKNKFKELFQTNTNEIYFSSVGGGCINETYKIRFNTQQFFCKINSASKFPHLFDKEANGLKLIAQQNIIKAAKVIDKFQIEKYQILLLEWIEEGERTEHFWKMFGEQLAALHRVSNDFFGLDEDNYMGSVSQSNKPTSNWIDFFIQQRLQPLIEPCVAKKLLSAKHQLKFERLYQRLPFIFDQQQNPSLLHGDLWSGNFMCNKQSEPILIDTAVYFGHPSVDIGMTTLFGGFHRDFYEAYNYHALFSSNFQDQCVVCNLYPLLVHLILFGSSYLSQIETILDRYS